MHSHVARMSSNQPTNAAAAAATTSEKRVRGREKECSRGSITGTALPGPRDFMVLC